MTATTLPAFDLADRIRKAREIHGWDIGEMADRLEVSRGSVSGWERRKHAPHHKNLQDISRVSGVPLSWLLGEDGAPPSFDPARYGLADQVGLTPGGRRTAPGVQSQPTVRIGRFSTAARFRHSFVSLPVTTVGVNGGTTWMPHGHISTSCSCGAHHSPRSTHVVGCTHAPRPPQASRCSTRSRHISRRGIATCPAVSSRPRRPVNSQGFGPSTAGR
ncbi:MAG: helix-turn-helix transcriptional regulator [bacterium]|nr:helix-turn-helix transcriptional regulator [bacterium]